MKNMSKKTMKKIQKLLSSCHFTSGENFSRDVIIYTPAEKSLFSAIWHHIEVDDEGAIRGCLLDDKCAYTAEGYISTLRVVQVIKSPEQFFHPRCHYARQAKQIAYRLKKMNEQKLAEIFSRDAAWLLMVHAYNGGLKELEYTGLFNVNRMGKPFGGEIDD